MKNPRRLVLAGLFLSGAAFAGSPAPVYETVLDNGMKIIVKEDHRAPVAVSQVWYKVGSSYEHGGITGISHMLEHLMFKGTERFGPGEFSRIFAALGASENAFTGQDYTAYYQKLAADRLEKSLEMEADRMQGVQLDNTEFLKERDVVAEERRMRTEDSPTSLLNEQFTAAAYQTSAYHHPVIGWMDDIRHYELDDAMGWYRRWYAPNNATLVVVGDVQAPEVFAQAKKYFGPLQPVAIEAPKPRREIAQRGTRSVNLTVPASEPYLLMGYAVPSLTTADEAWEAYALMMLAEVLDGGDSARLSRDVVRRDRVAVSASADYDLYARLSSLLTFEGIPSEGHSPADLQRALLDQVDRLRNEPVSAAELQRIKTGFMASKIYELDSVFYQAMRIGQLETVGLGWRTGDELVSRIQEVTPEQVRLVAQKYLVPERLTVATLTPISPEVADD